MLTEQRADEAHTLHSRNLLVFGLGIHLCPSSKEICDWYMVDEIIAKLTCDMFQLS